MADVLVSTLLNPILGNLNSRILEELGIASGLKTDLEKLKSTLSTIQAVVRDAESKQRKSETIENWLRKLKDAAYDADNVVESFTIEALRRRMEIERGGLTSQVSTFLSLRNPLIFRFKMGHRIKNVREKLDALAEEKNKFHLNEGVQIDETKRTPSSSIVDESETYYGRDEEKERIIEILLNNLSDSLSLYAIYGMGGLGKTTLTKLVYNNKRVLGYFELRIWVCVSDDFNVLRLTRAIIESIEERVCDIKELDPLQRRLQEKLRGRKFLLVLDDVWSHEQWNELKVALMCGAKGSTVLVTTRLQNVAREMATHPTHRIGYLSEGDSWSLFKRSAFGVGPREENLQLETIGKAIMEKCRGVPLAIKALGSLMRLKSTESEWLSVKNNEIWDLPEDGNSILPVLRLSYDNLRSHLRQCFAYCCIFPKDWKMEKDLLILLWMANGFIPSRGHMELYELGHEIFNDLVWRSFLQDVEEDRGVVICKMHDLMHDLAQSIVRHECCFLTEHNSEISEKIRHLCAGQGSLLESLWKEDLHKVQSLRSFISLDSYYPEDGIFTMLSKQKYLRVLVCTRLWHERIPMSISHLKHLRYLDFSDSYIIALPESTTCLQNLQTLKLRNCSELRELPRGMKYMRNLKYLDIRECHSLIRTPSGLGSLTCLQTLSIFIVGQKSGHNIGELKRLDLQGELSIKKLGEVKNSVEATSANLKEKSNLVCLNLIWSDSVNIPDHVEEVLDGLRPHPNLQKLGITSYKGSKFPDWLMGLALQNLVEVTLADCYLCVNLPPLGKLSFLEVLSLERMHSVKYFNEECFKDGQNSFPALKTLKMKGMRNLEEWTTLGGGLRFSSLLDLEIEDCPELKELPFGKTPVVEVLSLDGMHSVKYFNEECLEEGQNSFPALKSLKMWDMPNLEEWTTSGGGQRFSSLLYLEINGCPKLKELPLLPSIKTLCLARSSDDTLPRSVTNLTSLTSLRMYGLPNLNVLSRFENLNSLEFLEMHGFDSLTSLPENELRGLSSLRDLKISDCKKLESLSEGVRYLTALQSLSIGYCPEIKSLPEGMQQLAALQKLEISTCEGLCYLPSWLGSLPSLAKLKIYYCKNMTSLPNGMLNTSGTLTHLQIEHCRGLSEWCIRILAEDISHPWRTELFHDGVSATRD